jgi:hypothetical protein
VSFGLAELALPSLVANCATLSPHMCRSWFVGRMVASFQLIFWWGTNFLHYLHLPGHDKLRSFSSGLRRCSVTEVQRYCNSKHLIPLRMGSLRIFTSSMYELLQVIILSCHGMYDNTSPSPLLIG